MFDKFREECALFGVWGHQEASTLTYLGLYAQQHRGQEGVGVVSIRATRDQPEMHVHRGLGLVSEVFGDFDFSKLPGQHSIGHVRYTTAGSNALANVQPFCATVSCGTVALAHNGNLINADELREELTNSGAIFSSSSDTEVLLHLIARAPPHTPRVEAVMSALQKVKGAYSLVLLFDDRMIAVRDPHGVRPLCLGALGGATVVASETCAFDLIGARYIRDVEPGEVVEISGSSSLKSFYPFGITQESSCIFEFVYFARPDSAVFGRQVYPIRKELGRQLAREQPANADIVIAVPDSGTAAALGYSEQSKLPFEMGLIRNHYVGRTFIEPKQSIRDFGVRVKLNPTTGVLDGKSVVVVDDSVVRGTTSKKIVAMIRKAGVREVHLRVSSPPTIGSCYYGVDTPSTDELLASRMSIEEMKAFIGVDSLGFLSVEGMHAAVGRAPGKMCAACFSGSYPIGKPGEGKKRQLSIFSDSAPTPRLVSSEGKSISLR